MIKESVITFLWNGEKLPSFRLGRGIRKGDPIAPYLFILTMECLSWDIHMEVKIGNWKPITISRGGTGLSHLFFVDDLMLFAKATKPQAQVMMTCLNNFSERSGIKINLTKSNIFYSSNTNYSLMRSLGRLTGILVSDKLGTYLGVPIQKRVSKDTFNYILEKMKSKLNNWKADSLSFARWRCLVQLVFSTILIYTMHVFALPSSTRNAINKICRDFLWGDSEDMKEVNLVNWRDVCRRPREYGGCRRISIWIFWLKLLGK